VAFSYLSTSGPPLTALGDDAVSSFKLRLPSYHECLPILESYLLHCHALIPICDIPSLREIFSLPWIRPSDQISIEIVLLVCAVLYAAASTSPDPTHSRHAQTFSSLYKDLTHRLEFSDYFIASPSIPLLQAFVLYNTIRACQLAPFAAFGFLPQAIRFAQMIGLHKDQDALHPTEKELRRRTWWHLVFLDVEATISSGLQSIIRPNGHNVPLPSPTTGDLGFSEDSKDGSPMLVAMQGHWLLAEAIHKWFEQRPGHDEILGFSRTIKTLASRLRDESPLTDWARLYLQLQIDRAYCMLGLRFWQLDQFRGTRCLGEVVCTARSFLKNYLGIVILGQGLGFGWFVPGFLQPMHALVILLKHLSACSDMQAESTAGSCDLITQVMDARRDWIMKSSIRPLPVQLMPGSGVTLTDGRPTPPMTDPRYRMLWSLKEQVWRRFGWASATARTPASISTDGSALEGSPGARDKEPTPYYDPCRAIFKPQAVAPPGKPEMQNDVKYSSPVNSADGGAAATAGGPIPDRYFDIDDLIPPNLVSPVHWDAWLLDFCEDGAGNGPWFGNGAG
jgi:hypothetical protein